MVTCNLYYSKFWYPTLRTPNKTKRRVEAKRWRTGERDPHAEGADDAVLLGAATAPVHRCLAIGRWAAMAVREERPPRALGRLKDGGRAALPVDGEACERFAGGRRNRAEEQDKSIGEEEDGESGSRGSHRHSIEPTRPDPTRAKEGKKKKKREGKNQIPKITLLLFFKLLNRVPTIYIYLLVHPSESNDNIN